MTTTQKPEPDHGLFYVFTMLLIEAFPDQTEEFRECLFTFLDGRVYMWYEPDSEWFRSIGKPGAEERTSKIGNAWRMAVESQLSSPWREIYICPNN